MTNPDWDAAAEIEWETFYKAVEGRALRDVFVEALPLLPDPEQGGRPFVAVDLGCGDGMETLELLARGWTVLAVDAADEGIARLVASVPPGDAQRLTTRVASFADVDLPPADLVYAGLSLPFCHPEEFLDVWSSIRESVQPNGLFVGHFFGPNDEWASAPDMTFLSRTQVEELLRSFDVVSLREQDEDGMAVSGPKHWHLFHVIARTPATRATSDAPRY